jgi:hypothetical protein
MSLRTSWVTQQDLSQNKQTNKQNSNNYKASSFISMCSLNNMVKRTRLALFPQPINILNMVFIPGSLDHFFSTGSSNTFSYNRLNWNSGNVPASSLAYWKLPK